MIVSSRPRLVAALFSASAVLCALSGTSRLEAGDGAHSPAVGDIARDFVLSSVDGEKAQLSSLLKKGPVVLLVLRGFPGYQCPVCNAQVGQFLAAAKKFDAEKANVVLVYPGPANGLKAHAQEFIRGKTLPGNFYLLLDPDFDFTNAYHLRWEAKNETAYPSTYVIDPQSRIRFAKVSMTHSGRASVEEVIQAFSDQQKQ